jgi:hypothetical protein
MACCWAILSIGLFVDAQRRQNQAARCGLRGGICRPGRLAGSRRYFFAGHEHKSEKQTH